MVGLDLEIADIRTRKKEVFVTCTCNLLSNDETIQIFSKKCLVYCCKTP